MAWKKATQITSWSFSRFRTYSQCPARARYLYVEKLKEPGSPAMDRGSAIHEQAKLYVEGMGHVPKDLRPVEVQLKALRAAAKVGRVVQEESWTFRHDWSETVWNDWDGAWLRVKCDVVERDGDVVSIIDWKSGKFDDRKNDEYVQQLELYALSALVKFGDVEVRPRLLYTDLGVQYPPVGQGTSFVLSDLPALQEKWVKATKPMLNDTKFAPRPSRACTWCHFRKDNGGPCSY